jgi:rubrerythrin
VNDQARGAAVPLPRYTPAIIYTCTQCGTDLIDETWNLWCPSCRRAWSFSEVAVMDEGLPDD